MADNNNTQHIVWHDDVIVKQFISYAVGCMMGRYSHRQARSNPCQPRRWIERV